MNLYEQIDICTSSEFVKLTTDRSQYGAADPVFLNKNETFLDMAWFCVVEASNCIVIVSPCLAIFYFDILMNLVYYQWCFIVIWEVLHLHHSNFGIFI
jgi:hypothetical protein